MLTKPDRERGEADHLWPEFLPGGEAVLFTITQVTGGIETGAGRGAGFAHRHIEGAVCWRQPRALATDRGIWSMAWQERCAPWPSTSDGWMVGTDASVQERS